jgi:hypothetical protein
MIDTQKLRFMAALLARRQAPAAGPTPFVGPNGIHIHIHTGAPPAVTDEENDQPETPMPGGYPRPYVA